MELTAEFFAMVMLLGSVFTIAVAPLFAEQYLKRRLFNKYKGFERMADLASVYLTDSDNEEVLESTFNSITQLGVLAANVNHILATPDELDQTLTVIAQRAFHIAKMSMMGTASGDVKKKAYAEKVLNKAMIEGVKNFSPAIRLLLKVTELDKELEADPELFPLIMQLISENDGLMGMLTGLGGMQNAGAVQGTQAQEELIRDKLGFEY